ncbi:MAG: DUF4249 family protein [Bacteroidota bacterium]
MNYLRWLAALLFFTSCEKNIDFNLDESKPTLVVEAVIENDKAPNVILTKSLDYFSQISPAIYESSFVHNADVYISNGTLTHKLKEYTRPLFLGYNLYYYSIDSSSLNTAFNGELNHSYSLRVVTDGLEYLSSTTIPALTWFPDSIYFKKAPQNPDTLKRALFLKATEPRGLGNYIRYFTSKNSEPFYPGPNSVFTDEIIDGVTYTFRVEPGVNRNIANTGGPDDNFFKVADTVTLKFCDIDKATYTFWNTWEFANQSIGNPFAQPNKVIGNISNGALGAFCGYAAWYGTLIAQ